VARVPYRGPKLSLELRRHPRLLNFPHSTAQQEYYKVGYTVRYLAVKMEKFIDLLTYARKIPG
jgi:hypothetical protein